MGYKVNSVVTLHGELVEVENYGLPSFCILIYVSWYEIWQTNINLIWKTVPG